MTQIYLEEIRVEWKELNLSGRPMVLIQPETELRRPVEYPVETLNLPYYRARCGQGQDAG